MSYGVFWQEQTIDVADYVSPSKLSDFVINPYVGCPHACKYCYASFMKRFTEHSEPWGEFVDVKRCSKPLGVKRLTGKSIFMSSVTDPYNPAEERYGVTRRILEELAPIDCELSITTKSALILRDKDLLVKRFKRFNSCSNALFDGGGHTKTNTGVQIISSINTLDESFRAEMDRASTIKERLEFLQIFAAERIPTVLFMSPIFPLITDFRAIVDKARSFVNEIWFENLNLRPDFKWKILTYIKKTRPHLYDDYLAIYQKNDLSYWYALKEEIEDYCQKIGIAHRVFFHY